MVIVDEQLNASVEKSDGVLTPYEEFFNDGSDGADLTCTVSQGAAKYILLSCTYRKFINRKFIGKCRK